MRTRDLSGPWGEALAAEYLRKKGWRIEAMNYRTRLGEIDIIASNRQYLVFCEVENRRISPPRGSLSMHASSSACARPRFYIYLSTKRRCSRAST